MATAAVQQPQSTPSFAHQVINKITPSPTSKPQDVDTVLHYFKPNADGSPPHPTYVDKPETYYREPEPHNVTVRDVRGKEDQYTLDKSGFQFYKHVSKEKDFLDEEKIKEEYYPETEQLLKDA
jgi:hypothetical protein